MVVMATKGLNIPAPCPETDRWCWIVAFAAFWVNFCILGVLRSSAVIFVALVESYHVTREAAAWPSGIFGFCMCITGVLSGYLSHCLSIRLIIFAGALFASLSVSLCCTVSHMEYITVLYGACQGAGIGVIVPLTHVILNGHFSCYRAVAMGIAYAGSSTGSFFFPPLAHWMIGEFGLNGTFLLLGGVMMQSLIGVVLMRPPMKTPREKNVEDSEVHQEDCSVVRDASIQRPKEIDSMDFHELPRDHQLRQLPASKLRQSWLITADVLTNSDFLLISAVFAVYFSVSAVFLMVILDFSMEKLMARERGVFLVSAFSFGDLAGRLLCGWIGDMTCVARNTTVCCYLLGMAVFLMTIPLCESYELLSASSVALGLLNGGVIVNYSAILTELLGLRKLPIAVGFSSSIIGVTTFLRPLIIGFFRDKNNSYDFLFVSLGGTQLLLTILWMIKTALKKHQALFIEKLNIIIRAFL